MKPGKKYLNKAQRQWVQDWWRALQPQRADDKPLPYELGGLDRGDRAELRRCTGADQLLERSATFLLADRLIALSDDRHRLSDNPQTYERLALVAGVLAGVREDRRDGLNLSRHLGAQTRDERPAMSELRFRRLQRAQDQTDLYLQWKRAVQLADSKADVAQLAEDLLGWLCELGETPLRASDAVKFRWAHDYYLSARDRAAAEEPQTDKEANA
ncbi:type I-E CRISPR-associated protein Cse2/CasB [Stutzerimonas tarimensis]|uniref:Type I-E CRISPR-associated protein Cse2/CasB n=1 Tax=Stutzerimonas tarimensis TaxID=1507735 RepID=A0ABV7T925_9GAMM